MSILITMKDRLLASSFFNKSLNSTSIIALCVMFMVIFDNDAFWSSLFSVIDLSDPGMYLFVFACFAFIFSVTFVFLAVFGIGRAFKPLLALVIILASFTSYYMDAYGTVFDRGMVLSVVETNVYEAFDLFSLDLLLHVTLFGVFPSLLLFTVHRKQKTFLKEFYSRLTSSFLIVSIAAISVFASYKDFTFVFRENRHVSFFVNPVYPLRAVYRYTAKKIQGSDQQFLTVFEDAHRVKPQTSEKNILIMVVGETARAKSFHLNGYGRNTTPELEKHDVLSFKNVSSCGTATGISIPCIFSDLSHDDFDVNDAKNRQGLLDALSIAGIQVLWRENNPDCKGVCDRIKTHEVADIYIPALCKKGICYDEVLFNGLHQYIRTLNKDAVIVLHLQGSHGPAYFRRYPERFRQFLPECNRVAVQDCTDEEIVNAYDNSILYTDYFLARVINYLKAAPETKNSALFYVSDHGESLGENGLYLHGLPYSMAPEEQTHVPMIAWFSEGFSENKNLDISCLKMKEDDEFSHDNIIHSLLGLMDVGAVLYDKDLDMFASCRQVDNAP